MRDLQKWLAAGALGRRRGDINYAEFPPEAFLGSALVGDFNPAGLGLAQTDNVVTSWVCELTGAAPAPNGSPVFSPNGFGLAGKPCVNLVNGTSQRFFTNAGIPGTWPTGTAEGWLWALVSQDGGAGALDTATRTVFGYGTSGAGAARELTKVTIGGTASRFRVCRTTAGAGLTDTSKLFDGIHIVGGRYVAGGTNFFGRIDGADTNPASAATGFNTSGSRIGIGCDVSSGTTPGSHGILKIARILVTAALTTEQKALLEGWGAWYSGS
jgi:hypothetical protein